MQNSAPPAVRYPSRLWQWFRAIGRGGPIWLVRLSGPAVAILCAWVVLQRQHPALPVGDGGAIPAGAALVASATPRPRAILGLATTVCDDPAFSGCDAFAACMLAVGIGSGLADNPQQTLRDGQAACRAGRP